MKRNWITLAGLAICACSPAASYEESTSNSGFDPAEQAALDIEQQDPRSLEPDHAFQYEGGRAVEDPPYTITGWVSGAQRDEYPGASISTYDYIMLDGKDPEGNLIAEMDDVRGLGLLKNGDLVTMHCMSAGRISRGVQYNDCHLVEIASES